MKLTTEVLQKLKDKEISIEDLNDWYFINSRDKVEIENMMKLLNENVCSFQQIADKFKSIKDGWNNPCLYVLSRNEELFEELIQNNRLNREDLEYLLNRIDEQTALRCLSYNIVLLKYIIDKNILSFKELVDKFKSVRDDDNSLCLYRLLWNKEVLKKSIQNNRLNKDDLRYLLNTIDDVYELERLCKNTSLIKRILNEFILNKELVDKFNTIIEKDNEYDWFKKRNIHTLFDLIEFFRNKNNEEILELIELNKKVYLLNSFELNEDQKLELIEVLKDNEVAQNRVIQIIENHVESNYDFESLIQYLKKPEKKNLINI